MTYKKSFKKINGNYENKIRSFPTTFLSVMKN